MYAGLAARTGVWLVLTMVAVETLKMNRCLWVFSRPWLGGTLSHFHNASRMSVLGHVHAALGCWCYWILVAVVGKSKILQVGCYR